MQGNDDFDFFTNLSEKEQNTFLRTYLTETTRYLKAIPFPNSPRYSYYEHVFYDKEYHDNTITNLATLLYLLVSRDIIWPIRLKSDNTDLPYFAFVADLKFLDDADDDLFEIIQEDKILKRAKVLEN